MTRGDFPFWRLDAPLLLASGSAVRRQMLLAAGVPVEVAVSGVDERAIERAAKGGEGEEGFPAALATELAAAKALAVAGARPGRLVLGADQTLSCGGRILHKPADAAGAEAQIAALAGRTHQLDAAMALAQDGEIVATGVGSARLTMRPLAPDYIARYVAATVPAILASVGGYQIEGAGIQLFERIEGDHYTILGLPLSRVLKALRDRDAIWH